MIFRKIYVENFGVLHDFELTIAPGINRLPGKNEFGKTTLLEFIRRLFWGFPDRRSRANQYPALNGSGRYGGWIEAEMDDGRVIRLERFGERGELRCFDVGSGQEVPECSAEKLTNCKESFFRNIYAVTIDELRDMENLETSELRQQLYGSGLGIPGKMLPALDKSLKSACDELFRSRGTCRLKELMEELKAANEKLTAARSDAIECENARKTRDLCLERKESNGAELKKVMAKINSIREMIRRRTLEAEIADLQQKIADHQPIPSPGAVEELENIAASLEANENRKRLLEKELDRLNAHCASEKNSLTPFMDIDNARPVEESLAGALKDAETAAAGEKDFAEKQNALKQKIQLICGAAAIFLAIAAYFSGLQWLFIPAAAALAALPFTGKRKTQLPAKARFTALYGKIDDALHLKNECSADKISELNYRCKNYCEAMERAAAAAAEAAAIQQKQDAARKKIDDAAGSHIEKDDLRELTEKWRKIAAATGAIKLQIDEKQSLLAKFSIADTTLLTLTPDELNRTLSERSEYYESLMAEYSANSAEFGKADNLWQQLSVSGDTALAETLRSGCFDEIKEVISEYIIRAMERKLLAEAVNKFESERQPQVLAAASQIFANFTSNRYPKIRRRLDSGELFLRDEISKMDKSFSELSRGTAEQLLLSLRLALIAVREQSSEKIPVILDDVTVNFDPERSKQAADALNEFAAGRQVIILSCR